MNVEERLVGCFSAVFSNLSRDEIVAGSHDSIEEWDSLASLNVMTLIEEEFEIEADLLALGELESFADFLGYVESALS